MFILEVHRGHRLGKWLIENGVLRGSGSSIGTLAVALVNLAEKGDANFAGFTDMLLASSETLVQRQARFAQTGAGWVLRELSRAEPKRVIAFVDAHRDELSREALERAIGRLPEETQQQLSQRD